MFNKFFANKEYAIMFNTKTGFEVIQGINGKDDPFSLELPSLLDVGIMGHCVHSCPFCYQGHAEEPNMTLHNFKVIVDATKHHVNQIALGGRGDPNHHENFAEIVEYTRKNGMVPNYTTSGIDLTDEQIEISKLCGAVAVSQIFTEQKIKIKVRRKKNGKPPL
jgi:biotin synthase-like enzyme